MCHCLIFLVFTCVCYQSFSKSVKGIRPWAPLDVELIFQEEAFNSFQEKIPISFIVYKNSGRIARTKGLDSNGTYPISRLTVNSDFISFYNGYMIINYYQTFIKKISSLSIEVTSRLNPSLKKTIKLELPKMVGIDMDLFSSKPLSYVDPIRVDFKFKLGNGNILLSSQCPRLMTLVRTNLAQNQFDGRKISLSGYIGTSILARFELISDTTIYCQRRLPVSYTGTFTLTAVGLPGEEGVDGSNGYRSYNCNGENGGHGQHGQTGGNGKSITIYAYLVLKDGLNLIEFYSKEYSGFGPYYIEANSPYKFYIDLSGGNGGNGGDGGNGGSGQDETDQSAPGYGGNGGHGGNGGCGGDGGQLTIITNQSELVDSLKQHFVFTSKGGLSGRAGSGGRAGRGGSKKNPRFFEVLFTGRRGFSGIEGSESRSGRDGELIILLNQRMQ